MFSNYPRKTPSCHFISILIAGSLILQSAFLFSLVAICRHYTIDVIATIFFFKWHLSSGTINLPQVSTRNVKKVQHEQKQKNC